MIRDTLKDRAYFDKWIAFEIGSMQEREQQCKQPAGNPSYRPQFVYDMASDCGHLALQRYSRGDLITELAQYFEPLLSYWEESEHLGKGIWTERQQFIRHTWRVNLDHYIDCFWLIGLALSLNIPDDQWQRLLVLVGNEGEDILLDRIIASRQLNRKIGTHLCYPKPYQRLLEAIDSPHAKQAAKLKSFIEHWYDEIGSAAKSGREKQAEPYKYPYWYRYVTLEGGYFGYWCVEAVAAVKAFGLDDSLCLSHPNYPGDLLRPDGPTTHPQQVVMIEQKLSASSAQQQTKSSWFTRLFGRK